MPPSPTDTDDVTEIAEAFSDAYMVSLLEFSTVLDILVERGLIPSEHRNQYFKNLGDNIARTEHLKNLGATIAQQAHRTPRHRVVSLNRRLRFRMKARLADPRSGPGAYRRFAR